MTLFVKLLEDALSFGKGIFGLGREYLGLGREYLGILDELVRGVLVGLGRGYLGVVEERVRRDREGLVAPALPRSLELRSIAER